MLALCPCPPTHGHRRRRRPTPFPRIYSTHVACPSVLIHSSVRAATGISFAKILFPVLSSEKEGAVKCTHGNVSESVHVLARPMSATFYVRMLYCSPDARIFQNIVKVFARPCVTMKKTTKMSRKGCVKSPPWPEATRTQHLATLRSCRNFPCCVRSFNNVSK